MHDNPASESVDLLLESATGRHRAGDLVEARRLYEQVLAAAPGHTVALFRSGLLDLQAGRADLAATRMAQAAAAAPHEARYAFGLGSALQNLGRWDEAARAFESALVLEPGFVEALTGLGFCRQRDGDPRGAAAAYRHALELQPGNAGTLGSLGSALRELGELPEALVRLREAMALEPRVAAHGVNLGIALCQQCDFDTAEQVLREVLADAPGHAEAAFNLGVAQNALGRTTEAIASYRLAAASRTGYVDALINLGNVLADTGAFTEALTAYDEAIHCDPGSDVALNNAGCLLRTLGRLEEAERFLSAALRLVPDRAALHDNLGNVLKDAGQLDRAIDCFRQALALDPASAATHGNLAYALSFQSEEPAPILAECRHWDHRFADPRALTREHRNDTRTARRLRIGYVSPDFRDHCQSLFTIPVLAAHDHSAFEIFCYSTVKRPDHFSARIAGLADVWRDVRRLADASLDALIGADGIDILVDLTMHMAEGRPQLFARRPAPVQVAWLAYPGTTGIRAIDYRLSDPRLDPPGADGDYSERTIRLADSFWCYDPLTEIPEVNPLPAARRGYVTLGCLNNPCKLTDHTLRLWGPVFRELPSARLILMAPPGSQRQLLAQRLEAHGIPGDRVEFTAFRPRADYLGLYHEIDMGLDTFPYNGHTTSFDSLWMGVPVVTRVGRTCVGRAGLSQLHHLDLMELAADSDAAFVTAVVSLATDWPRLAVLRGELRPRLRRSPLMDGRRFARQIEGAYRKMWETYCRARANAPGAAPG